MSAATMNGAEAVKGTTSGAVTGSGNPTTGPKQQLKSNINAKSVEGARKQASSPVDNQTRKQQQPVKAWQGHNPITQRASTNATNGADKPLPKLPSQSQQVKNAADGQVDKQAYNRLLFLLAQFTGKDATVNLKNGEQFLGVFSGASCETPKSQYVLKMTRRTRSPPQQQGGSLGSIESSGEYVGEGDDYKMAFDAQDIVSLTVQDVVLASASKQQNGYAGSSFLTDTQISNKDQSANRHRQLQRWEPGPDSSVGVALEDSGETGWDQFEVNARKYGVETTWDESIYTTTIDRSNPQYRKREAEADRIARQIESEDRHKDTARDDLDEEEKYSGVRREAAALPKRATGAYIPPAQRPITGVPTVSGAPFDPAIISTKISQQAASKPGNVEQIAQPSLEPTTSSVSDQPNPTVSIDSKPQSQNNVHSVSPVKKHKENTAEDHVKDHVRNTTDAFKQFANNEKLKIRQAQEAKRSTARQEKNVKLNDLKKFAANFKLKSRVPDDLVPILAKDREKQLEIQKKAEEAAREEELRVKEKDSDKPASATSPAPPNSLTQTSSSTAIDTRLSQGQHRQRPSQTHIRQPLLPLQGNSPRAPLSTRAHQALYGRGPPQPLPADLRIPAPNQANDAQMSPSAATRLNVNAKSFEFRPGASTFQPSGASPSPRRESPATLFGKDDFECVPLSSAFDTFGRLSKMSQGDENLKKSFAPNGGFPQAYRTPPTWPVAKENDAVKYLNAFPKPQVSNPGPSPIPTPNSNISMLHNQQMQTHLPGQPMPAQAPRQPYYPTPQPGHATPFDPRFAHFNGPNGSVQNSPRAQALGPVFNNQLQGMPMPQYPGQPVQGYGMSPSLQYRQLQGPGAPVMMVPGQSPAQLPMRPNFPPAPQFQGPQMGGHMMAHNPSGGYIGGPMQNQGYSPMPPHAQPHMPHMQHGGPAGYSGSPRPPMMQAQGSHQGYQPQMHMQPGFAPPPGQAHPYHMQRGMSGQYPQMTPRQQHALPQHPSPGMPGVGAQGDEGK